MTRSEATVLRLWRGLPSGGRSTGFEHAVEGGAADAQAVGGADLIAVAAEKDIEDVVVDDVV
jgi:hypothetical protein